MFICAYCNNAVAPNSLATLTAGDVIKPARAFEREIAFGRVQNYPENIRERYIRQLLAKQVQSCGNK